MVSHREPGNPITIDSGRDFLQQTRIEQKIAPLGLVTIYSALFVQSRRFLKRKDLFTGIVERLGTISSIEPNEGGYKIRVDIGEAFDDVVIGDSIALNGCCLTVVGIYDNVLAFDAGQETWSRTTMRNLTAGSKVNIERSLRVGDRLGGHYVTGHVDDIGKVYSRTDDEEWSNFVFEAPDRLMKQMVPKGSITVDGVSLTLVDVTDSTFSVALIPHTLAVTTLGDLQEGGVVNLESDVLSKYVERQIQWSERNGASKS